MSNVLFRYSPELTVFITRLHGSLQTTPGHPVASFNDPNSFVLAADAAEIRMSMAQLSALMNSWLLRSPKAQLKNIAITAQGNELLIRGTMKKGLHIPFKSTGEPTLSNDNRIRINVKKMSAADLPVKGVMDALGMNLDNVISQKGLDGISVDKDSFLIDPQTAFPAPQLRARITGVRIAGQDLVLSFGKGAPQLERQPWKNYIAIRGGATEYGREETRDADLTLIDITPNDPFEYYMGEYWCQIAAGTIKAKLNGGMRIFLPDYSKMPKGACHAKPDSEHAENGRRQASKGGD
jgi:hypothetical protein